MGTYLLAPRQAGIPRRHEAGLLGRTRSAFAADTVLGCIYVYMPNIIFRVYHIPAGRFVRYKWETSDAVASRRGFPPTALARLHI